MEECLKRMPDKEFNPKTCMFVKKCKEGEMRNELGKCVKKPKSTPQRKTRRQIINAQNVLQGPLNKSPGRVKFNPTANIRVIPSRDKLRMRKRFTARLINPNNPKVATKTRNSLSLTRKRLPLMDEDSGLVFEQPSVNLNAPNKPRTRSRAKKPLFQALDLDLNNEPQGNYGEYAAMGRKPVNELKVNTLVQGKTKGKAKKPPPKKPALNSGTPLGSKI